MFDANDDTVLWKPRTDVRWPLPRVRGCDPVVLGEHVHANRRAVDLGYEELDRELFVPVLAAKAGLVTVSLCNADGHALTLEHGAWSTHYAGLAKMFVAVRQQVSAGEILGYVSTAMRLRFEIWRHEALGDVALDPFAQLRSWTVSQDGGALVKEDAHG